MKEGLMWNIIFSGCRIFPVWRFEMFYL